jgi:Na+-transporting NADH:ubiquinone oxidoreductase subunit A
MQVDMKNVIIKKGYRFKMAGAPSHDLVSLDAPSQVALCADKIPYIKPKLKIRQGDTVQIGSLLMEDKRQPAFRFLSPAAGTVHQIKFGPRRVIEAVIIDRDQSQEAQIQFPRVDTRALEKMARELLVDHILQGGLWWIFRELPFRNLPQPEALPPLIIVSLDAKEPFQPSPEVYLKDRMDLLRYGVRVLNKLADGQIVVSTDCRNGNLIDQCKEILTHTVSGNYPSDDPATLLYHIKQSETQNRAWTIDGQDVLLLAQLLTLGYYPTERVIAVGGSAVTRGRHYRTRIGVPVAHLVGKSPVGGNNRITIGGLMRGYSIGMEGFMGLHASALTLLPKGEEARFLSLFNPGLTMPSYSRTFLSRLNPKHMIYDCNLNGGRRACIACMHCVDICPVDILPQMAYKAIMAEEIEESLQHGLLDCVECGLCAYVCPSKIELSQTFIAAKAAYAKETGNDNAA